MEILALGASKSTQSNDIPIKTTKTDSKIFNFFFK